MPEGPCGEEDCFPKRAWEAVLHGLFSMEAERRPNIGGSPLGDKKAQNHPNGGLAPREVNPLPNKECRQKHQSDCADFGAAKGRRKKRTN